MSEQAKPQNEHNEKSQPIRKPATDENIKPTDELTEDELSNAAGGRAPSVSEIVVTKHVDKSSPTL